MDKQYLYSICEDDDHRLRSKLNTPKKQGRFIEATQLKRRKKSQKKCKLCSSHSQKEVKSFVRSQSLEEKLGEKVKEFKVISRTLRQFLKDNQKKGKNGKDNLQFGIKMIKAFNKTHIEEVSPFVKQLVDEILNSLNGLKEESKKGSEEKKGKECHHHHQQHQHHQQQNKHEREFSFSHNFTNQKLKYGNYLLNEIEMLSNNLHQLKEEAEILSNLKQDFDEGEKQVNKRKYINELEEIVKAQQNILLNLQQTQNQNF